MNKREVFDYVVDFITKQGKPARNDWGHCRYRTPEGLKCAAGCLIPDDIYSENMENKGIKTLVNRGRILPDFVVENKELISRLQSAHDNSGDGDDFLPEFLARTKIIEESEFM